jgi:hypothetical protein
MNCPFALTCIPSLDECARCITYEIMCGQVNLNPPTEPPAPTKYAKRVHLEKGGLSNELSRD